MRDFCANLYCAREIRLRCRRISVNDAIMRITIATSSIAGLVVRPSAFITVEIAENGGGNAAPSPAICATSGTNTASPMPSDRPARIVRTRILPAFGNLPNRLKCSRKLKSQPLRNTACSVFPDAPERAPPMIVQECVCRHGRHRLGSTRLKRKWL